MRCTWQFADMYRAVLSPDEIQSRVVVGSEAIGRLTVVGLVDDHETVDVHTVMGRTIRRHLNKTPRKSHKVPEYQF